MKDFNFGTQRVASVLLIICILAAQPKQNVLAVYTMAQTCQYYPKGYIADPNNCQGWGYCSGGALIQTGVCGKGLLYDAENEMCNTAAEVTCQTTVQELCSNVKTPQFVNDPNDCNQSCYCNQGLAECSACPMGQVFVPSKVACVWEGQATSQCPADSLCRLLPNNAFVGNPGTCGYLVCNAGSGTPGTCSVPGTSFNTLTGNCEFTNCVPGSNPGTSPGANGNILNGNGNLGGSAIACQAWTTKNYITDGKTCYGYYYCTSKSGPGTWGRCPPDTHFNPTTSQCVSPVSYACPHNRCGNLDVNFVADFGCKTYTTCQNYGRTSSGNSCTAINSNYPFFDERAQGCVVAPLSYAICQAAATAAPTTYT